MMYSEKYNGAIKRIGLNPLIIMYWSKEQAMYDAIMIPCILMIQILWSKK